MWVCLVWNIHDLLSVFFQLKQRKRKVASNKWPTSQVPTTRSYWSQAGNLSNDLHDEHNLNEDTLGLKWLWFQICNAWLKYKSLMKPKTATGVCIWSVNNSDVWFRSICWNEIDFRYSFGIQTINPPGHKPNSKHYLLLWYREANEITFVREAITCY